MGTEYLEDLENAASFVGDLAGETAKVAVTSATDFVTTTLNSALGIGQAIDFTGTLDQVKPISTEEVLRFASDSLGDYYKENEDVVHTLSFVGGLVGSVGIALKGLNAIRGGVQSLGYLESSNKLANLGAGAVNVFSGAKKAQLTTEIEQVFAKAGSATESFGKLKRALYGEAAVNFQIDNLAMEIAMIGTMNAHPFMEDYTNDLGKNFMHSMAFGALFTPLGMPAVWRHISDVTKPIEDVAIKAVQDVTLPFSKQFGYSNAANFQIAEANRARLNELLDKPDISGLTAEIARNTLTKIDIFQGQALEALFPGWKELKSTELKDHVRKLILNEDFSEIERVNVVKLTGKSAAISGKEIDTDIALKILGEFPEKGHPRVFYRPSENTWYDKSGVNNIGRAVDLANPKVKADINLNFPVNDFDLETLSRARNSAEQDLRFLSELERLAGAKSDVFKGGFVTSPTDLPRLNALVSWIGAHPTLAKELKIQVRSDMPTYQKIQIQQDFVQKTFSVPTDYWNKLKAIGSDDQFKIFSNRMSQRAYDLMSRWQDGTLAPLRRAMDNHLRGTALPAGEFDNAAAAAEIWRNGQKAREELKKIADSDGNIYLYRGIRGELKGAGAVESFTFSPSTASGFGSSKLFKVHVDNVIGVIGHARGYAEGEILVGAPHHPFADANLLTRGATQTRTTEQIKVKATETFSNTEKSADDIIKLLNSETESMIKQMAETGEFSFDEIASRLNITKQAATMVVAGKSLEEIPNWRRYTDASLIKTDYLNPEKSLLAVSSNKFRNPLPELVRNLDVKGYQTAHLQFMEELVLSKGNDLAKAAYSIFEGKEMVNYVQMLRNWMNEINNATVGNPRWQSIDNALRRLMNRGKGVEGELLTYIGKRTTDTIDQSVENLLKPMVSYFKPLTDGSTQIVEFNKSVNFIMGLKGYKEMVIDPETNFAFFVKGKISPTATVTDLKNSAILDTDGQIFYIKQPEVIQALQSAQKPAKQLYDFHNLMREFRGLKPLEDIGFYLPPPSLINKHYSYVMDESGRGGIQIIIADTATELAEKEKAFEAAYITQGSKLKIVNKHNQEEFNLIHGYADGTPYVTQANVSLQHGGSSRQAIVPSDASVINQIFSGYEFQLVTAMRKFNELYLHDITNSLDRMSDFYRSREKSQPLFGIMKTTFGEKDSAMTVKNLLLGRDNREISTTWKTLDDSFDMMLNLANNKVNRSIETAQKLFGSKDVRKMETAFLQLDKDLKAAGVKNPWTTFQEYYSTTSGTKKDISTKLISAGNTLAATMMLRLFDMGFVLANVLSTPIMGTSAVLQAIEKTRLPGVDPNKFQLKLPLKLMMDGIAHIFSPEGKRINKIFESEGHINQAVRQYAEVTGLVNSVQRGTQATDKAISALEGFINSDAIKLLAKPADLAENLTRQAALHTGFSIAKKAYPGIGDKGATILAVSYADKAIGNYYAHQRPVFFQGTLGSAISLYQTYMLTYAQSMFRDLEMGAFKRLGATFLMQAGVFGLDSLPGYNALSEFIGKNYSYDHTDLNTGAYRAVGDTMADILLYGLPSNILFDSALYTRGDVSPRVPSVDNIAIYNTLVRGYQAASHGISSVMNADGSGKLRAFGEALSLQTLNRPLARWSEIAMGNSITRNGNTVQTPAEVWTISGVMSRMLALRPLEEQKLRNAIHLQTSYGQADYQNRQEVIDRLRTAIRNNSLDNDLVEDVASKYILSGGSSKGFNSALNHVMIKTESGARADLMRKLEADSPVRRLIDENF